MICELVTVAAITLSNPRRPGAQPRLERVCLHTLIRRARRNHDVIIDCRTRTKCRVLTTANNA
jgi:hypothetical protein